MLSLLLIPLGTALTDRGALPDREGSEQRQVRAQIDEGTSKILVEMSESPDIRGKATSGLPTRIPHTILYRIEGKTYDKESSQTINNLVRDSLKASKRYGSDKVPAIQPALFFTQKCRMVLLEYE